MNEKNSYLNLAFDFDLITPLANLGRIFQRFLFHVRDLVTYIAVKAEFSFQLHVLEVYFLTGHYDIRAQPKGHCEGGLLNHDVVVIEKAGSRGLISSLRLLPDEFETSHFLDVEWVVKLIREVSLRSI